MIGEPTTKATNRAQRTGLRGWLLARDRGALAIVLLFVLLLPLSNPRVALSDEVQYYAYLRSVYFDGDLDFRNEYAHFASVGLSRSDQAVYNALLREDENNPNPRTGLLRNVAPVGSALLWAPGYLLADLGVRLARLFGAGVAADGYSWPYIWAACYMSALYALLGLLLSYRLACRFSSRFAASLATLTIWLATPLFFYSFVAMPWSHATAFFLFSLFLTLWLGAGKAPLAGRAASRGAGTWAALGLLGGLMTITREQLGLLLIIPAVEGLLTYAQLLRVRRWPELRRLLGQHLLFLVVFISALAPQLLAYQILNGQPRPSATVAGKLNVLSEHFFGTLIDPRHGAFLWSPILPLGLLGLLWLARHDRLLAALLALGFLAQTYINGAFGTTWHLRGSFGFRRLIECTPIFVLGLAALIEALRARWRWAARRWILAAFALLFIYWNVGLLAQWAFVRPKELRSGLVWDDMLYYQVVEVPRQVADKFDALLFDRCRFMRNCGQAQR